MASSTPFSVKNTRRITLSERMTLVAFLLRQESPNCETVTGASELMAG